MTKSNMLHSIAKSAAVVLTAAAMCFSGCVTTDDTLGQGLLPGNQEMITGTLRLANAKRFFETRLYQTDSVRASNIGSGYFGASRNDTTGLVDAGFMSQFLNYYRIDSGYFGYRPIFDSAQLILSINNYSRDTLTAQDFEIYEITSSDYLSGKTDSLFYINFDPAKYISAEPLFSFTFPNGTTTGPKTTAVTLVPTAKGREFVNRLMISDGTKPYQEGVYYSIYKDDKAFINVFKGLYIKPKNPTAMPVGKGSVYGTDLLASGFAIHCRNRVQADPTLIKDTVGSVYYFRHTDFDNSNMSINTVHHDYTGSQVNIADAVETNLNRPTSTDIIVSGMGGVISELTFTQEFFDALEAEIARANEANKTNFTTLAMNRGVLTIYFTGSDYDWRNINQAILTPQMSAALPRLGSYTNFKKTAGIIDYDYYGEANYGYTLAYGGYINRSQGCFDLDISGYLQKLWNSYLEAKKNSPDGKADLSKVENRSVYLGPDAYNLFTNYFAKVQGMEGGTNNAPLKIDLTYTLIK